MSRIINISVVDLSIATKPEINGRSVRALMGAADGPVLGVGGAFGREYFDGTFSTEEDVRRQLNLPILSSTPGERK